MTTNWSRATVLNRPHAKKCKKCGEKFSKTEEFAVSTTQDGWFRGDDFVEFICVLCTPDKIRHQIKLKYKFEHFYIPPRMMGGIERYIKDRIMPGDFLVAVICNNLKEAVLKADEENMGNLPAYVAYFYNEAPFDCWGSLEKFKKWLSVKKTTVNSQQNT